MDRIFLLAITFLIAFSIKSLAQSIKLNVPLPIDETIKKGGLPNGMACCIFKNVGSILENDKEQGLSHFLEHMNFNGTKNFPDKDILNTLQRHEAVFGKDMAGLPAKNIKEDYGSNRAEWLSNTIGKSICIKMENLKASVIIVYKKVMAFSRKNVICTSVLGDNLQLKIIEIIRQPDGAYSTRTDAGFNREPKLQAFASFNFNCSPDMVDKLVSTANNELKKV